MTRSIAILASLLLVGCAREPVVVDTACTAFAPISYSAKFDSEQTKAQIRGHNAAYLKLCKPS